MPERKAVAVSSDIGADTPSVCMDIIWELAAKLGCDPIDIDPLAESVDPDALETIIGSSDDASILFDHAGCTVEVTAQGSDTSIFVTRKGRRTD
jgi:hypothetical protein